MNNDAELSRTILDAIPFPVLIVDRDVRAVALNAAAARLRYAPRASLIGVHGGDILGCVNRMASPEGCGHSAACSSCVIRNSVAAAMKGEQTKRKRFRVEASSGADCGASPLYLLVTAVPLPPPTQDRVLVMLEDISSVMVMHGIVCVCSRCKRLRDDDRYWHTLEGYLKAQWDVDASHGYCPECTQAIMRELDAPAPDSGL